MSRSGRRSVVELADRPVPQRRAALVLALILLALAAVARPMVYALWDTANRPPRALTLLRDHASPPATPPAAVQRRAVVVLVDGMRLDEARELPSLQRLRKRAASAVIELQPPTLSKPFYHTLLTAVPVHGSGVRTNRFAGRARVDSLADRVRAAGGRIAWLTEELDWLPALYGDERDRTRTGADALDGPLDATLGELASGGGPALTLVHILSVDAAGHDFGVQSEARARALQRADRVLARVLEAVGGDAVLAVVSDHGHIAPGGHGGPEPEVRRVPFLLRAPGLAPRAVPRPLRATHIAPTLARWMGVAPPRSAVAGAPPQLSPPERSPSTRVWEGAARSRARMLRAATRDERAALAQRRLVLVPLCVLVLLCALGAVKRALRGFDLGTIAAPVVFAALVLAAHRWLLQRPFSLSAIDDVGRHAVRLGLLGLASALIAIAVGAPLARRMRRRTEAWAAHLRRASAAVALFSIATAAFSAAWVGFAVGPWPLAAEWLYAQVIAPACTVGATIAAAAVLLATAFGAPMHNGG